MNYLAVDLGASGGRVLLGRFDGARFQLSELHRFANGPVNLLGSLHWDAIGLYREMLAGLAAYSAQSHEPAAGLSVDTWGVDYGLLDARGALLGNPYHYRDARTHGVSERVMAHVSRERLYDTTGIQVMPINTLYQLVSALEVGDPQLAAARTLLMMPDLFHYWLTGEKVAEYTIASTSQLLDARTRGWATDLIASLDLPTDILPPLVSPGSVLGELRGEVKAEVGLGKIKVIATGAHDTASAVAAIAGLDSSAYISSGTWSLMGVEVPEPIINPETLRLNFTNEGGVAGTIRLLKNLSGLWLLQESQQQWRREGKHYGWDELLSAAEQAAPFRSLIDPNAADFLSPGDMPAAIRAFCQRTGQPIPESVGEVVRCALESLALGYRWVFGSLEQLTQHPLTTIRIVGGGCQNALLCQFTADACERPVVAGPVEATALGNLMLQAVATGKLESVAQGREVVAASAAQQHYTPRHEQAWQEAFGRFEPLLGA